MGTMVIDFMKLPAIIGRPAEKKHFPKHVLVNLYPLEGEEKKQLLAKLQQTITDLIDLQKEQNLPILTIALGKKEHLIDEKSWTLFMEKIVTIASQLKMRITVLGRWYDLSGELVEALKRCTTETSDYDHFFLNFCINYDGQQEISDACKVMIKKIAKEKIDVKNITPALVKENIYSSMFLPPDVIVEPSRNFSGSFLWDSQGATIICLQKKVKDIAKIDIAKAIEKYAAKQ